MNVFFYTLGCKVNQYETEGMKEVFSDSGFVVKDKPEGCDVLVINSCTVTSVSDKKTRQMIHKFKKGNPGAVVALTGCFPQAFPEEAAALLAEIETASRLKATAVVNNSHLGVETKLSDLTAALPFAQKAAELTGLPLLYSTAPDFALRPGETLPEGFKPIRRYVKFLWEQEEQ